MPNVAARNPDGMKKFKSKLPFVRPTSIGPSRSPSIMQANLPQLFALLTTQPKADEDERRCDVAGMATEPHVSRSFSNGELVTTPRKTTTDKCEAQSSSYTTKISESFEYDSPSGVLENETSFVGEDDSIVNEKPEPKALTESDAVVRKVQEVLQEKGLAMVDDVSEELLCSSPPLLILEGTLTAFLDRRTEYRVLHDDHLYTFFYYQDHDYTGYECGCSFVLQDGGTAGTCLAPSNNNGCQYAVVGYAERRRARASSLSNISYEFAVDDKDEEQQQLRMKDGWSDVLSPSRHQSRELKVVHQTCETEAPDLAVGPCPVVKGAPEESYNTPRSHAREVHQLCVKMAKPLKTPDSAAPVVSTSS